MKKVFFTIVGLGIIVLIALLVLVATDKSRPAPKPTADKGDEAALIKRGAYLSRAGDCMACHSVPGKPDYAGGLAINTDLGTIYSTNITPDKEHGIGNYTEAQFADAVRNGVRADGTNLYPAMPYPDFVKISDEDIHALYTYFMKGVKPSAFQPPETELPFPFGVRPGMKVWNALFRSEKPFAAPVGANDEVARGAYLVQSLGHCGSCHTARGIGMHEKALSDSDSAFLAGGNLNGWDVPSLRGLPDWSKQDIVDYLATGRNRSASVAGEMTSVVEHSTSHLEDADLGAIAAYLKSLKPNGEAHQVDAKAAEATTAKLTAATGLSEGERLYIDNCAACHAVTGKGAPRVFPSLEGASIVNADSPTGLIHVILAGAQTPSTAKAPSMLPMPGFASRLSDKEVAELAGFVRSGWSNKGSSVSEGDVADVRKSLAEQH